ncbi:MAG: response regulator [Acidobacteria bacterium]|nr:response regulator [Acidobacteriota bacterium]
MKTLLVIDPDTGFHAKVKELLKPGQIELVSADNGADAVQLAVDMSPDMIILNLELKDLNGFLVCSSLKKNPTTRSIPLVITSGKKTEADFDQHRKLKFRADSYFSKPLSAKELSSLLIDFLGANVVQTKKATPLGADFDEENIDKLLDSTFTAFSTDGSQSQEAASMSSEPVDSDKEDEKFDLELALKEEDADLVPSVDLSDLEEEAPAPRVDTGDLEPDVKMKPAKKGEKIETLPEDALKINRLKQVSQQKAVQVITLQKENEFLKTENRNLLMDLTSLKADVAEREQELTRKKEAIEAENLVMKARVEEAEAALSTTKENAEEQARQYQNIEARNLKLEEEIDALQKENQGLTGEMEQKVTSHEESLAELSRQLLAEESRVKELEKKCRESEKVTREFGEKENMLMTTIENLTKNTRELEDELKVNREKLKHLSDILKSAAAEVDFSES